MENFAFSGTIHINESLLSPSAKEIQEAVNGFIKEKFGCPLPVQGEVAVTQVQETLQEQ